MHGCQLSMAIWGHGRYAQRDGETPRNNYMEISGGEMDMWSVER